MAVAARGADCGAGVVGGEMSRWELAFAVVWGVLLLALGVALMIKCAIWVWGW